MRGRAATGSRAKPMRPRSDAGAPTFGPQTIQMTEQAIPRYEAIAARGGWPAIPPAGRAAGSAFAIRPSWRLRHRLIIEGDLDQGYGVSDIFDACGRERGPLVFSSGTASRSDGVVREQTFAALNVPAHIRA